MDDDCGDAEFQKWHKTHQPPPGVAPASAFLYDLTVAKRPFRRPTLTSVRAHSDCCITHQSCTKPHDTMHRIIIGYHFRMLLYALPILASTAAAARYSPNRFLGTCLTNDWVADMEAKLGVSGSARNPDTKQLLNPFLHAALPIPRYSLVDSRMSNASVYSPKCMPTDDSVYGPDAVLNQTSGKVLEIGHVAGSLVLDMNEGTVHRLITLVFGIVAAEMIGYNVTFYSTVGPENIVSRISLSDPQAQCTPVHVNPSVRSKIAYSDNSWLVLGDLGNRNVQGMYTTKDVVADGHNSTIHSPMFDADFWRDYVRNDDLISMNAVSNLRNNSVYFPPSSYLCANGTLGCQNHCLKTYACTLREAANKECLVIVARRSRTTPPYRPALIANLKIPAYMCFIGRSQMQKYALEMYTHRRAVLFYMDYPDEFFARYPGHWERISLPKGTAEEVDQDTGVFGENGYGQPSANPVHVAPFDEENQKIASFNVLTKSANQPVLNVFSRIRLVDTQLAALLDSYINITNDSSAAALDDPYFTAACKWVQSSYSLWTGWLQDPLPLCTVEDFMQFSIAGCNGNSSAREISFAWRFPDPSNGSNPYVCDGGVMTLPPALSTSRSCGWLNNNTDTWLSWATTKPVCDETFYTYVVQPCDANSKHRVNFVWLLPDINVASSPRECEGELPATFYIDCEYMPTSSGIYIGVSVIVWILVAVIIIGMLMVFHHRAKPIIRRSQFEFLESMLLGTLMICGGILVYGGEPSIALCAARPVLIAMGFTLVFGSLLVKSLRVYRIFMSKGMKRVVLTARTMAKVLVSFLFVDAAILVAWFIVDIPGATDVSGTVDEISSSATYPMSTCSSSHFIFSALLMFWKALLLGTGLYLSFLVRKVSVDFQESVWIFSSSVVVAFACLLLLPLAYLVPLPAATFYVFFAGVLWVATLMVLLLMFGPKIIRHKEDASAISAGSTGSDESQPESRRGSAIAGSKLSPIRGIPGQGPSISHASSRVAPAMDAKRSSVGRQSAGHVDSRGVVPVRSPSKAQATESDAQQS